MEFDKQVTDSCKRMMNMAEETAMAVRDGKLELKEAVEINNSIGKHAKEAAILYVIHKLQKGPTLPALNPLKPKAIESSAETTPGQ